MNEQQPFEERMIALYKDLNVKVKQVQKAKLVSAFDMHGFKAFEILLRISEDNPFVATIVIQLETMKQLGVTSRLNGHKKVQQWLETPEGLGYVIDARSKVYQREIRRYQRKAAEREAHKCQ